MKFSIVKKNFFWQKVILGIALLVVGILLLNIYQSQVKNYFHTAVSPISKIFWRAGDSASNFLENFASFSQLANYNSDLEKENQQLLRQIALLESEALKNEAVNQATLDGKTTQFTTQLVEVVGLDTANDSILINKGADDGIEENMPVVSAQNILYGKVIEVYKNFSRVMLISHKNSVLDIKIQAESSLETDNNSTSPSLVHGALKGEGSLSMYLDLVSTDAQINDGDVLMTSALDGTFPRDLLVGKILSIDKNDARPFQTARVKPFFDTNNIANLFVIKDYLRK